MPASMPPASRLMSSGTGFPSGVEISEMNTASPYLAKKSKPSPEGGSRREGTPIEGVGQIGQRGVGDLDKVESDSR